MLKFISSVVGVLLIFGGSVHAQEVCNGTQLTPTEFSSLPTPEKTREFRRLLECTQQSLSESQDRLNDLADIKIDELADGLESERHRLNGLAESRRVALEYANAEITSLVRVRNSLYRRIENLTVKLATVEAENEEDQAEIAALEREIAAFVTERDRLHGRADTLSPDLDRDGNTSKGVLARIAAFAAALKKANAEAAAFLSERVRFNGLIATLNTQLEAAKAEHEEVKAEISTIVSERQQLNGRVETLTAELELANAGNAKTVAELRTVKDNLASARSQFFGRLSEILGDRKDIRVVGDRFVFQSEVLFAAGSALLYDAGRQQIVAVAKAVRELEDEIPLSIKWVLQVNGHTDIIPVRSGGKFASNWDLSTARSLSVVRLLQLEGVPPDHLSAAGFGEYQPLQTGDTPEIFAQNRRIELKLTDYRQ